MRKVIHFLLLFTLLCAGLQVQAQQKRRPYEPPRRKVIDIDIPQNIIKVNFLSPFAATGSFFYERVINEQMSLQLGLSYTSISTGRIIPALFGDTRVRLKGYAITPEFRYYLSSTEAPRGFFVAPFIRYRHSDAFARIQRDGRTIEADADLSTLGAGIMIGGQWIFGKHISMDMFMGPSLNARFTKVRTPEVEERDFPIPNLFGPFGFRAGITIGVAF
jgi:hypothetical protein